MTAPSQATVSVLIVDDDEFIRQTLVEILEDRGYTVATAKHGGEALEVLGSVRPDVILLDVNMPVMSGTQFRAAQRLDPSLAIIPTVVMTAGDRATEAAASLLADGSLPKPIKLSSLLLVVSRYAGGGTESPPESPA